MNAKKLLLPIVTIFMVVYMLAPAADAYPPGMRANDSVVPVIVLSFTFVIFIIVVATILFKRNR